MRSLKQAESEDCDQVDIEHFEKILPQLVSCPPPPKNNLAYINVYLCYLYVAKPFHKIVLSLFVSWILKCFCKLWCYMSICAVNMHLYTLCHLLPVWQIIIKTSIEPCLCSLNQCSLSNFFLSLSGYSLNCQSWIDFQSLYKFYYLSHYSWSISHTQL